MQATLLVIDNYDSFTFNLVQMFRRYPLKIDVFRADKISVDDVVARAPDYILISPGPKGPKAAGISTALISRIHRTTPILGVCLGMQCINEAFGGITIRAPHPVHGTTSSVTHWGRGLFDGVPSPVRVARYHSLVTSRISDDLDVTAMTADSSDDSSENVVMGISHRKFPVHGVQFHPESFLTEHGFSLIENFLSAGPLKVPLKVVDP